MGPSLTASDIVRSMTRVGFSRDEIYDVLSGIGLPGDQVQLIIDRVATEFHEAGIEPRPSRLAVEVKEVFERKFEEFHHATLTRVDLLTHQLELLRTELEKLGRRVVELQSMTQVQADSSREKRLNKSHKDKVGKRYGGKNQS